jgi:stress response protein YsnF
MDRTDDRAITRSEEELHIGGTQLRTIGKVRLRKRIVTEWVDVRVQLRREELVIFEQEIEDGEVVEGSLERSDDALEIILHAEEPILESLQTRVVPRERIRAHLDVVTEERAVRADLRREVVDVERQAPGW